MTQQAQQEAAARPRLPTEIDVRLYRPSSSQAPYPSLPGTARKLTHCAAPPLHRRPAALGSAVIMGAFMHVREGENGPFVSMPSRQVHGEYRDICFPCTSEFRQAFDQAVLDAYRMEISQMAQPAQKQDGSMGGMSM